MTSRLEPGGADRHRRRLDAPLPDPRGRDGRSREPLILERTSCSACSGEASTASSSSSPTITQGFAKSFPRPPSRASPLLSSTRWVRGLLSPFGPEVEDALNREACAAFFAGDALT